MSWEATSWAMRMRVGDAGLKLLLLTIANYANDDAETWHSQEKICFDSEIPERTLRRKLDELKERGLIEVTPRRREDGTKTTSLIRLIMSPPANLAAGDHRPKQPPATGQNEGSPPANMDGRTGIKKELKESTEEPELSLGAPAPTADLEKQFFDRAVDIIKGPPNNARKIAGMLLKACGKNIAQARSALETSAGKSHPQTFLVGHIHWLKKKAAEPQDATVLMTNADDSRVLM